MVEPEVDPVDHRVDRGHGERTGPNHRCVVADPAHDAVRAGSQQLLEGGDERELARAGHHRCL
jgi:hypothetical protein